MPVILTTDEERDVWMRPLGNQIAPPGWRSTAIYHAPNGRRTMVTGTYYVMARRRKALTIRPRSNRLLATKESCPTWAAFLSYLLVALRHQANLARWPKPATLLPFACTEDVRAHSLRPLQAAHSSQHFRGSDPTVSWLPPVAEDLGGEQAFTTQCLMTLSPR